MGPKGAEISQEVIRIDYPVDRAKKALAYKRGIASAKTIPVTLAQANVAAQIILHQLMGPVPGIALLSRDEGEYRKYLILTQKAVENIKLGL